MVVQQKATKHYYFQQQHCFDLLMKNKKDFFCLIANQVIVRLLVQLNQLYIEFLLFFTGRLHVSKHCFLLVLKLVKFEILFNFLFFVKPNLLQTKLDLQSEMSHILHQWCLFVVLKLIFHSKKNNYYYCCYSKK